LLKECTVHSRHMRKGNRSLEQVQRALPNDDADIPAAKGKSKAPQHVVSHAIGARVLDPGAATLGLRSMLAACTCAADRDQQANEECSIGEGSPHKDLNVPCEVL
jgi:hypothetical protein